MATSITTERTVVCPFNFIMIGITFLAAHGFILADAVHQDGIFPDIPNYKRLIGKDCRDAGTGLGRRQFSAFDCATECNIHPNCSVFVVVNTHVLNNTKMCYLKNHQCLNASYIDMNDVALYLGGQSGEDDQQCDTGYFPQIIGYRRHYGDCYGNDLGQSEHTLSECIKMCNEDQQCKAFTFVNPSLFRLFRPNWPTHKTCLLKSNCSENTLERHLTGVYTYFKDLTETETTPLQIITSAGPSTDNDTSTCITSDDVDPSASNPVFTVTIDDVTTKSMAVQIYYGDTVDNAMCNQLEKVLFTYFPNEGSCSYYKECALVWECHANRICEFQCHCPRNENGICKLDLLRKFSEEVEWHMCDIRV